MAKCFAFGFIAAAVADELPASLQQFIDLANSDPEAAVKEINESPLRAIAPEVAAPEEMAAAGSALPTVLGHGMGDSCFNPGMKSITKGIGQKTGSYSVCVPTGDNIVTDTIHGFLMTMDKSVDVFAAKIKADKNLANGFNCVGFSQGNSLCRGYIQKYNDPPANAHLSVHGTVMGVAAFPGCFQQGKTPGLVCKALAETLGDLAYNSLVQGILFQANYFRDAAKTNSDAYKQHSQIAKWNLEDPSPDASLKANFIKVNKLVMVKAAKDSMVYPNQGEQYGSLADGDFSTIQEMKDTKFYKNDMFGLKTLDEANKIYFEETAGDHLQFTDAQLYGWVEKYLMSSSVVV